jgi:hypothetical protein
MRNNEHPSGDRCDASWPLSINERDSLVPEENHPDAILRWSEVTETSGVVAINVANRTRQIQATASRFEQNPTFAGPARRSSQ